MIRNPLRTAPVAALALLALIAVACAPAVADITLVSPSASALIDHARRRARRSRAHRATGHTQ